MTPLTNGSNYMSGGDGEIAVFEQQSTGHQFFTKLICALSPGFYVFFYKAV
jgi:hypothetical protein